MRSDRTGAFSDAVIAIAITVMVLELPKPDGASWEALRADAPVLCAYVLSFAYLGIYWNNHHQLLAAASRVSGSVLWANLHLLFWLTLVPFTTSWMAEQDFATVPVAAYGFVLLMNAVAYMILQTRLLHAQGPRSALRDAVGRDRKGKLSPFLYIAGMALTFVHPLLGLGAYVIVALVWFIPDPRHRAAAGPRRGGGHRPVTAHRGRTPATGRVASDRSGHGTSGSASTARIVRSWIRRWYRPYAVVAGDPVSVISAFHRAQPRASRHVASGTSTASENTRRSVASNSVHAITRSHAGSPTPQVPKSMTADSRPSVVRRLPTPMSPWNHPGGPGRFVAST